ncbi:uncharacterized protein LOC126905116 isoform X2 [Daktulosphaira vitifoliae]|uniref:uncharacterized protein LOC126905116 isoform X2 n=1 Tax=Daktulosphaira vitifoliae TaxID=58002 RepID=UPI0021AA1CD4|nr:uncharacterized protein LOC126905116 isoform X2 [Daktulosphaira vitifoliae]
MPDYQLSTLSDILWSIINVYKQRLCNFLEFAQNATDVNEIRDYVMTTAREEMANVSKEMIWIGIVLNYAEFVIRELHGKSRTVKNIMKQTAIVKSLLGKTQIHLCIE